MKKKILIVTPWYPRASATDDTDRISGIFIADQARALTKAYDVAVLHADARHIISAYNEIEEHDGLTIFHFHEPMPPTNSPLDYQRQSVRAALHGFQAICSEWGLPHLIHAHIIMPGGWAGLIMGRMCRIPVVLTEHTGPFSIHLNPLDMRITSLEMRRLVRCILYGVERVVAVSPYLAEQMRAVVPDINIEIIGNVISPEFFEDGDPNWQKEKTVGLTRFLAIGIDPLDRKGIPSLLKAAQILNLNGEKQFEICIGGAGSALPHLERLATQLGVMEQCHFLGGLTRAEARRWMHASDVFVLPSMGETFSVATAEAMACGKPAIVTRCGGPEFFTNEENGVFIPINDAQALANAMQGFIHGEYRFEAERVRQSIATRFHPEIFLKDISQIYEQVEVSYLTAPANKTSKGHAQYAQDMLLLVDYSNVDANDTGKLFEIALNATRVFFPGFIKIIKNKGPQILKYFAIGVGLFLFIILLSLVLIALGVWLR